MVRLPTATMSLPSRFHRTVPIQPADAMTCSCRKHQGADRLDGFEVPVATCEQPVALAVEDGAQVMDLCPSDLHAALMRSRPSDVIARQP